MLTVRMSKERLMRMACFCPLCNIPNEFLFKDRVNYLISISQRVERKFAIMFIDLNKFKAINDTYGHAAGDYVLVSVANILKYSIRKNDIVARLHGDEFVILFDDVEEHTEEVTAICHKIAGLMDRITYQEVPLHLTASIGFSFFPQDGKTVEELLNHSDKAMYNHKKCPNTVSR
jgi:diguanylate cyclase (GGDEF)-like protein